MNSQDKARIMQVVLSLGPGGTERLVIELSKSLAPTHDVRVCCLDEPGAWADELTEEGIEVIPLGRTPGFDWGLIKRLAREFTRHGSEIVHCHHYSPFVYGALASAISTRARVIYTEHGRLHDGPPTLKRRLANRLLFGRVKGATFAVSRDLREHMVAGGLPDHRVGVIHNGISPGPIPTTHDKKRARATMSLPANSFAFGTVARLDPVKDLGTLLQGFAQMSEDAPKASPGPEGGIGAHGRPHLVLIGDGDERRNLERLAAELGIADQTRFLGHRDDVRDLLPGLNGYVNTSITEGVSVTLLEAMAAQVPIVATAVGGTPEVILDEASGLLLPPRDPSALATQLARLWCDPKLATKIAANGRARVEAHFATSTMRRHYLEAYQLPPI